MKVSAFDMRGLYHRLGFGRRFGWRIPTIPSALAHADVHEMGLNLPQRTGPRAAPELPLPRDRPPRKRLAAEGNSPLALS